MAQPEQQAFGERQAIPLPERMGHVQRRPDRHHDTGGLVHLPQHVDPEEDEATNTRVFEDGQRGAAELGLEELFRAPFIIDGDRRTIPFRIEETPILPTGAGRGQ